MRLGQLARNLNVSPSEIIHFLQNQGYTLDSGTNSRLGENQVRQVLSKFAPEKLDSLQSYISQEDEAETSSEVKSEPGEPSLDSNEPSELPETIRAPKIELQGLKVLGKIDLPEPKKKQPEMPAEPQEQREDRPAFRRREQRPDRPWVNPLERQRQREAREAEEKKRRQAEQRKELRTAAYLNRQKRMQTRQRTKEKAQSEIDKPVAARPVKPKPTSFFGRIWYWLTNAE